ncbi:MAG: NAD-binding protein [Fusobacteria bacterium]|nr:NAD-binding protein [Fusobacteriota bacterium]
MHKLSWKHQYIPIIAAIFVWINSSAAVISVIYPFVFSIYGKRVSEFHVFMEKTTGDVHISWFFQVLIAYVMIMVARGIYNRKKSAFTLYVTMLCLFIGNDLFIAHSLNVLSLVDICVLVLLLYFRSVFNVKSTHYNFTYYQIIIIISVLCAFTYGVVGTYILRNEFYNVTGWTDAFYFTIVTYATVGYGDIHPLTETAKMFVITMIIFGLGTFATGLTVVIIPLIEERMREIFKIVRKVGRMQNHIVLCGYTPLTRILIKKLSESRTPFVIIDSIDRSHPTAEKKGYPVLIGESSDTEVLKAASIEKASSIIILNEMDSDNILTIITAKALMESMGVNIKIIVKIDQIDNIKKAEHSGADEIISPALMAAESIIGKL